VGIERDRVLTATFSSRRPSPSCARPNPFMKDPPLCHGLQLRYGGFSTHRPARVVPSSTRCDPERTDSPWFQTAMSCLNGSSFTSLHRYIPRLTQGPKVPPLTVLQMPSVIGSPPPSLLGPAIRPGLPLFIGGNPSWPHCFGAHLHYEIA